MPQENIVYGEECFQSSSSRKKYSACKPSKTSSVTYHNLQGVAHILEANQSILSLV